VNEVQEMARHTLDLPTPSPGSFSLTFTLASGESFTTGLLTWDGSVTFAATLGDILAAINLAAVGVSGWADGDIQLGVEGFSLDPLAENIENAAARFTYSGASVAGQRHGLMTTFDANPHPSSPGTVTVITPGSPARIEWAALTVLGVVDVTDIPTHGDTPSDFVATKVPCLSNETLCALARGAAITDGNSLVEEKILKAVRLI